MTARNRYASVLMAIGLLGIAPAAHAAPASQALLNRGESAKNSTKSNVIEIARRGRGRTLYPTIGPNYLAYDYPYYYRRGFYPQHIGPGYIHYGYPYFYGKRYSGRCAYRGSGCAASSRHERSLHLKRGG